MAGKKLRARLQFLFLIPLLGATLLWGQDLNFDTMQSLNEWRWGVIAYNDGLPGKALLAMERAISLNPTDSHIQEWLGHAYWKSGMEMAALSVWDELIASGEASTVLVNRAEQLRRHINKEEEPIQDEWSPFVIFNGVEEEIRYFRKPTVARNLGDNSSSLVVSSYADGELVILDVNGTLVERFEGGIDGFIRPFDILPTKDNRLLVSEFQADRISVLSLEGINTGYRIETWGETGRGKNQLMGPQYMAYSPDGVFVYISDWGNRRISKWTLQGDHVLNFNADRSHSGFLGPTGIACFEDKIYVADSLKGYVEVFDPSGHYLGTLITEGLSRPEGLTIYKDDLLIADGSQIFRVDLVSGELSLLYSLGEGNHRITNISPDDNGNLALSDFNANRVTLLTPLSTLYGGLDVLLNSVRADKFPRIVVDFTVQDRMGNPVTGLDSSNFRIFDGDLPVGNPQVEWQSFKDSTVSIVPLVDSSGSTENARALIRGLEDLVSALNPGDKLSIVEAIENPAIHKIEASAQLDEFYRKIRSKNVPQSMAWGESLRLSINQLILERNRKAVIAFVETSPSPEDFDTYGLVETAQMMVNNGILFYVVYAHEGIRSRELDYIATKTKGKSSSLFHPEGTRILIKQLREMKIGRYTVAWDTRRSAGFGRTFMPVSLEVVYINKSGRAESGAFAPLQ